MSGQINQKTVAKNTLMLYIRMGVMMIVSLYTSRVVLATLGVDDFGIYNVVGGVVVMFSFMSITLTVSIRRFLAYELGQNDGVNIQQVFNASIIAVFLTSLVIVLGLESIGLWFLNNKLNIPEGRMFAANFVFQVSIITFFLNMNMIPFSSAIVVYEKMGVYAYLGIAETVLKLLFVLFLTRVVGDKLQWYSLFMLIIAVFIVSCNIFYCRWKIIGIKDLRQAKWKVVSSIFSFSAWSVFGTVVYMIATQGVSMIYNIFYGVAINAALGVAHQVANAIKQFIDNFQTAFNPQLTKSYSAERLSDGTFSFVCQTSRLSFLLVLIIGVPILANVTPLLTLWLGNVPEYAVPFSVIFVLYTAIDGCSGPLSMLVYAKGDVKLYQLVLSAIQIIYVLLVYALCKIGIDPVMVLTLNVIMAGALYLSRLIILRRIMSFPIARFCKITIFPLVIPLFLLTILILVSNNLDSASISIWIILTRLLLSFCISLIVTGFLYVKKEERAMVLSFIRNKF